MPNLQIPVSPEFQQQLRIQAAVQGVTMKDMIITALAKMLAEVA